MTKGLTKREHFAIEMLKSVALMDGNTNPIDNDCEMAIKYADELLKQLDK